MHDAAQLVILASFQFRISNSEREICNLWSFQVLSLLGGEQIGRGLNHVEKLTEIPQPSMIPDLINNGDSDDLLGMEDPEETEREPKITNATPSAAPLIDDLLGDNFGGGESTNQQKLDDDPFADVSFHISQEKDHVSDLFSGMAVDKSGAKETHVAAHKTEPEPFDLLNSSSNVFEEHENPIKYATNLIDGLSINGNDPSVKKNGRNDEVGSINVGSVSNIYPDNESSNDVLNSEFPSEAAGMNANPIFPLGAVTYNFPPGLMFSPAFASQAMNYGAMGSHFAQQQFLATMSNFHQLGNLQSNTGINAAGLKGGNPSPLPDIFNPCIATQPPTSMMNGSKREDTKAFDFISVSLCCCLLFCILIRCILLYCFSFEHLKYLGFIGIHQYFENHTFS